MPPPGTHGAAGRRRKHVAHEEEEGGSERWLVTYADMLTLLLVLFIVLFSISVVNTSKFISLKTSLAAVFGDGTKGMLSGGTGLNDQDASGTGQQMVMPGNPVVPNSGQTRTGPAGVPRNQPALLSGGYTAQDVAREVGDFRAIQKKVSAALKANHLTGNVRFAVSSRGLVITMITNKLVFPGNSATLRAGGQHILAAIVPALAQGKRQLEVDGYTNQQRTDTYPYPSGWELSSARASAVVRYLSANGIAETRLSAVGFNDLHPLYPASDPRSITMNRRVEIIVLSTLPSTAGPALKAAGAR